MVCPNMVTLVRRFARKIAFDVRKYLTALATSRPDETGAAAFMMHLRVVTRSWWCLTRRRCRTLSYALRKLLTWSIHNEMLLDPINILGKIFRKLLPVVYREEMLRIFQSNVQVGLAIQCT